MSTDDTPFPGPVGIVLQDCINTKLTNASSEGIGDGLHIIGGRGNQVSDFTKKGPGSAIKAYGALDTTLRDIRHIGADLDPDLIKALEKDIQEGNKEGFFSKIYRFSKDVPVEKINTIISIADRFF